MSNLYKTITRLPFWPMNNRREPEFIPEDTKFILKDIDSPGTYSHDYCIISIWGRDGFLLKIHLKYKCETL